MLSCRIALLRRYSGMSQTQLAKQLHISPSALGMYEQGRRTPSLEILISMSIIFNVSLDYLINGSEFSPDSENEDVHPVLPTCPYYRCCKHK